MCNDLNEIVFEDESIRTRIGEYSFQNSWPRRLKVTRSVIVMSLYCLLWCNRLETVVFETGIHIEQLSDTVFWYSALHEIVIPNSIEVRDDTCFAQCSALRKLVFEAQSESRHIGYHGFFEYLFTTIPMFENIHCDASFFCGFIVFREEWLRRARRHCIFRHSVQFLAPDDNFMQPKLMSHRVNHVYLIPEMDIRTLWNGRQPIQRAEGLHTKNAENHRQNNHGRHQHCRKLVNLSWNDRWKWAKWFKLFELTLNTQKRSLVLFLCLISTHVAANDFLHSVTHQYCDRLSTICETKMDSVDTSIGSIQRIRRW
jgi:hypothetical protein